MTESSVFPARVPQEDREISLLALGSVLLRWRRTVVGLGIAGATLGLAIGLTSARMYVSSATFVSQGNEGGATSGLALAASQLGIRVPSGSNSAWGPPVYVELLTSQTLLGPIALDTFVVAEKGGRRIALMELLGVEGPTLAWRTQRTVRALGRMVTASEDRGMVAVRLKVATKWPSVSLALASGLVRGVNQFILETRRSQAREERIFVEARTGEAERSLREAEDQLQQFLQRNRTISSPELGFERDRMQRLVALRQQVYTTLLQNREDARIREVRDTPVITLIESPRLPVVGESRNVVKKVLIGGFAGCMLGAFVAFLLQAVASARRAPTEETREFFQLVEAATPRYLRRAGRS